MHHHCLTRGLITLFVASVLSLSDFAQAGARQDDPGPRYEVIDPGEIKDYPSTVAFALNAKGVFVGQAYEPIIYFGRATVYRGGKLRALVKGEKGYSTAVDINASGQVVGNANAEMTSPSRAMLWQSDTATDLGDLGGDWSAANAINDAGVVVGTAQVGDWGQPFVWVDGEMTALPLLSEGERGTAIDVNADGLVAGESTVEPYDPNDSTGWTVQHAVVWDDGEATDLGTAGGDYSGAQGINAAGQFVGWSTTVAGETPYGPGHHAILWNGDEIVDLGTLAEGEISNAEAINARGDVVGRATIAAGDSGENHAFLWRDGELLDLNDLIEGGSDVVLAYAYDINDKGLIVAMGYGADGLEHAFLLKPLAA